MLQIALIFVTISFLALASFRIATRIFYLDEWELYKQVILFLIFECIYTYIPILYSVIFHLNSTLFAGRCANHLSHEYCRRSITGARRNGDLINFEYDEKFHYFGPVKADVIPGATTILFLHGNSASAFGFSMFAEFVLEKFPNVNVCYYEYPGYGARSDEEASIYKFENIRSEIAEAWTAISTKYGCNSMILCGFSIGGGFAWSSVDRLSPAPSQLILMNTFSDLNEFVKSQMDSLGISRSFFPLLKSLLIPSSVSTFRISNSFHKSWKGGVVVVHTADDELFSSEHERIFREHFEKNTQILDYKCLELPKGGHNESFELWKDYWLGLIECDAK